MEDDKELIQDIIDVMKRMEKKEEELMDKDLANMDMNKAVEQIERAHSTNTTSKAKKIIVKEGGVEGVIAMMAAMEQIHQTTAILHKKAGAYPTTNAIASVLMSSLELLVRKGEVDFAKAIMSDIHTVCVAENWPILSCVHIEQKE